MVLSNDSVNLAYRHLVRQCSAVGQPEMAILANAEIPSAMIFIRNENGSHNPHEDMKIGDFMSGVAVMRKVLAEAAL
jgi:acetylornithine deacetylase/succinyl-diaminopimelate desuccinylase-like protein